MYELSLQGEDLLPANEKCPETQQKAPLPDAQRKTHSEPTSSRAHGNGHIGREVMRAAGARHDRVHLRDCESVELLCGLASRGTFGGNYELFEARVSFATPVRQMP